jgi:hypothetical protein
MRIYIRSDPLLFVCSCPCACCAGLEEMIEAEKKEAGSPLSLPLMRAKRSRSRGISVCICVP